MLVAESEPVPQVLVEETREEMADQIEPLPWWAAAAAAGGVPAALWDALSDIESRKLKSEPFLKQMQAEPGAVTVSYNAGSFEVRGPYSSVSGWPGGDGEFLIARVDEASDLLQRLEHLATFRQRLDQQLKRARATNPRSALLRVRLYDFASGDPVDRFDHGDLFGFSVELDSSVAQPMYIQMINLSCDTMEIQALDLSGAEATAPGNCLKPRHGGEGLHTKRATDGTDIYAFDGGTIGVDEGYAAHNAGKPAAVCFVFVATTEKVGLDLLDMDAVEFGARGIGKIKKPSNKAVPGGTADCVTACVWMEVARRSERDS